MQMEFGLDRRKGGLDRSIYMHATGKGVGICGQGVFLFVSSREYVQFVFARVLVWGFRLDVCRINPESLVFSNI